MAMTLTFYIYSCCTKTGTDPGSLPLLRSRQVRVEDFETGCLTGHRFSKELVSYLDSCMKWELLGAAGYMPALQWLFKPHLGSPNQLVQCSVDHLA